MHSNLFHITSKIVTLARSGRIALARKLFDEMPQRDLVAWNAMLTCYSQLGLSQEAQCLFYHMRISNMNPDHFSFTAALSSFTVAGELHHGRKIHALVVNLGYQSSLPVGNSLIDMYGKCLNPSSARRAFEEMNSWNEVSWCSLLFAYVKCSQFDIALEIFYSMPNQIEIAWNILISGYARCGEIELCMDLFKKMQGTAWTSDQWTFSGLMTACAELPEPFYGLMMHGCIIKSGWSSAVEVNNSVLSFYAKLSCRDDAVKVFESIETRTQVSWNAMIDAHMKIGDVHEAFAVFQQAPEKNIVSWTSMITGCARNGHGEQALSFFVDMMKSLLQPDDFTFGAILHACSNLAVLGHGRMIHGCIIHYGFLSYVYVGNGLVNMYAKCGDLEGSIQAFRDILDKDLVSWNAMLFGFGLHGRAIEALRLYEDMVASRERPDKVTFIGLLMTCSHSGLIEKGRELFKSMESIYGLSYEADHVSCMVDMLGRGGYLTEANELFKEYSKMVNLQTSSCEALLGACAAYGNAGLGMNVGKDLMKMEPQKEVSYVLLSNLYCASGQWKEAEKVRKAMVEQGVKKMPGCSWIEVRNKVMSFVAGNHSHPYMEEIYLVFYRDLVSRFSFLVITKQVNLSSLFYFCILACLLVSSTYCSLSARFLSLGKFDINLLDWCGCEVEILGDWMEKSEWSRQDMNWGHVISLNQA
ncbi:hypothetical protein HHK36_022877 [Tetracentron sinense]|uniref:Uncharacterized protein n=1 Tax=Tetracentron sinense TaxID=13715 RepID=A0A834YQC5_TETSI|nr:hypothetical protein HHK36_022877 [Tetracentron sinense]